MTYQPSFPQEEYARRVADVQNRMAEAGLDLLICQDPANMCWLTGYNGWSFYTPQSVLVPASGGPIWFGRPQDAEAARQTTFLPDADIAVFDEARVHQPVDHPHDDLCQLIRDRGWAKAGIGVDFDAHYYTARAHHHLVSGLPDAEILDNKELVNWARAVKSPAEIAYMREAGQLCSHVTRIAMEGIRPGRPVNEVVAEIYHAQTKGLDGKWGDYTAIAPLIQIGEGCKTPHLTWSDTSIPESAPVMLEIAGSRFHYHAPITRSLHLGPAPAPMRGLAEAIIEAGDDVLAQLSPGNTCADAATIYRAALARHGFSKESRVGYSIGLSFPPDWGERTMSMQTGDETELRPGMCFHMQGGVWRGDMGLAISEPILITDQGCDRLCDVARDFPEV